MSNNIELLRYVTAFVLGDGAVSNLKRYGNSKSDKPTKKNSKYYIKQTFEHKDYIDWQANILENLTKVNISYTGSKEDSRGYICKPQYSLTTRVHPFYTKIRKRMYIDGKRVIDPHYLKLFNWQSLATLYMDDGWIEEQERNDGTFYTRIAIATMRYSYADNKMLRDFIAERFGVHFNVSRKTARSGQIHYYLRTSKDNAKRFLNGIADYMQPSYYYKLGRLTPL